MVMAAKSPARPRIFGLDWGQLRSTLFSRRSQKRKEEEASRQWFLLCGQRPQDLTVAPDPKTLEAIIPPPDRFWADPFLWSTEGRQHLFFEEYPYAEGRGRISVMAIDSTGKPLGDPEIVLSEPHHLSYPYLFTVDGEMYMVPEQKAARRVDVYRCIDYPSRFEKVATWFKGVRMVDVTVFEHEGRWWLFCAVKAKGLRYDESLCAFYSDHPLKGVWTPHPLNPLVRDFRRGRPGGRVFQDAAGRLLRPSQDCRPHYGAGLNLSEIELLTPEAYRERPLWHLSGHEAGGWRGLHHLDIRDNLMVMDAERTLSKPAMA
jgi:hypothetical protein